MENTIDIYLNPVNDFAYIKTDRQIKKIQTFKQNGKLLKEFIDIFKTLDRRELKNGL